MLLPLWLCAQTAFIPVKDEVVFRKEYIEAARKISTLKASFIQEKNISMLKDKLISSGEFYFKKDGRVRMEYTKPFQYLFILNKEKVYIRSREKEVQVPAGSSRLFSQISRITLGAINGDILTSRDFSREILESDNRYLLKLTPLNRDMKLLFKKFHIYIDKKNHLVESLEMIESSGDTTTITFSGTLINIPLSDALFVVK